MVYWNLKTYTRCYIWRGCDSKQRESLVVSEISLQLLFCYSKQIKLSQNIEADWCEIAWKQAENDQKSPIYETYAQQLCQKMFELVCPT